jgi:AraC-type DNA-binding domain-containing proteins
MPNDQCLLKALEYIDENIKNDISLYDISCAAGFSVPHFYRLFKRLTGDTVGAYIRRRKLSLAAEELQNSSRSVSSIAYDYGFESHDVFTRAFIRVYGISPMKYRRTEGVPPLKRFTVEEERLYETGNKQMTFHILHIPEFEVIGMECDAQMWDGNGAIGRLWSDFLTRVDEIKRAEEPVTMYGICEHENCECGHFKYMAAVGIKADASVPEGMTRRRVKAQSFFQASVPDTISTPDAYAGTIGYAKSLGYEIAEEDNIEFYADMFQDPAYHSFQLLIPIKK